MSTYAASSQHPYNWHLLSARHRPNTPKGTETPHSSALSDTATAALPGRIKPERHLSLSRTTTCCIKQAYKTPYISMPMHPCSHTSVVVGRRLCYTYNDLSICSVSKVSDVSPGKPASPTVQFSLFYTYGNRQSCFFFRYLFSYLDVFMSS